MKTFNKHLISYGITFVATFFTVFAGAIANTNFSFSKEALASLAIAGVIAATRALAKVIYEVSISLLK